MARGGTFRGRIFTRGRGSTRGGATSRSRVATRGRTGGRGIGRGGANPPTGVVRRGVRPRTKKRYDFPPEVHLDEEEDSVREDPASDTEVHETDEEDSVHEDHASDNEVHETDEEGDQTGTDGSEDGDPDSTRFTKLMNTMEKAFRRVAQSANNEQSGETRASAAQKHFQRLNPPTFLGGADPEVAEKWIVDVELIFESLLIKDNDLKVACASRYLRGDAGEWWKSQKEIYGVDNLDWDFFKEIFLKEYFPQPMRDAKRTEFIQLIQGNMSVRDYQLKFMQLSKYFPEMVSSEVLCCQRFEQGLRPKLLGSLAPFMITSFDELVSRALKVEATDIEEKRILVPKPYKNSFPSSGYSSGNKFQPSSFNRGGGNNDRKRPRDSNFSSSFQSRSQPKSYPTASSSVSTGSQIRGCYSCGSLNHKIRDCPRAKCHKCGGFGHLISQCSLGATNPTTPAPFRTNPTPSTILPAPSYSGSKTSVSQNSKATRSGYQGSNRGGYQQPQTSQTSQARVFAIPQATAERGEPSVIRGADIGREDA